VILSPHRARTGRGGPVRIRLEGTPSNAARPPRRSALSSAGWRYPTPTPTVANHS
jgi:hypothetical protein